MMDFEAWVNGGGGVMLAFGAWLVAMFGLCLNLLYHALQPLEPKDDRYGRRRDW